MRLVRPLFRSPCCLVVLTVTNGKTPTDVLLSKEPSCGRRKGRRSGGRVDERTAAVQQLTTETLVVARVSSKPPGTWRTEAWAILGLGACGAAL